MRVLPLHLSIASGSLSPVKLLPPLLMVQLWAAQALLLPGNDTHVDLETSGTLYARDSYPWEVSLFHSLQFQCTGVLVDQNWVLAPAHCWKNKPLMARFGGDFLLLFQKKQQRSTSSPVFHPKYRPCSGPMLAPGATEHDLMMLKLSSPVMLMSSVEPVKLPSRCAQPKQECQVSGWGTTVTRRGKYNRRLSRSRVILLSQKQCKTFYPDVITNHVMCAEQDGTQDSCQNDSSGPLVCEGILQGIPSWGVYPCGATKHPVIYTRICQYISWIEEVIHSK